MSAISRSIDDFALDLLRTLSRANPSVNMLVSPLSISSALAMVYMGARGDTAVQMEEVLSFKSGEDVHSKFETLIKDINSPSKSYSLKTANYLFGQKSESFLSRFEEALSKYYRAYLNTVDFIGATEASRVEINTLVEQQTENQIKDILKLGTVSRETKLVLVNAIYLKATWKYVFFPKETTEMLFKVSQTESKPVQMMFQMKKLPYKLITISGLKILELPFVAEELSMLILLPKESTDGSDPLVKLVKELTLQELHEWTDRENMTVHSEILVHLPKFKLEDVYELKEPLSELGMRDVFNPLKADLSGMNGGRDLFVTEVVHKALMTVNEEGIEVGAATGPKVNSRSGPSSGETFTADHPFLFFIRHNKTKTILFLGRFSSPQ
ncbi:leukocyte elastase inhibitor-like [Limanda limanda]|uniref:leukocyte elastase inhibitor-like n=1 Tax=Limanda limanda TaxID=27771 RepID=UPI0029C5FDDA|nr:leukocyte elastase inhibitor-like [Limanda limanda]